MTSALGGVENGEAKHILAAIDTANNIDVGFIPNCCAALNAIGARSTAVAVLLINIVMSDVVKYIPAMTAIGPN